MLISFAFVVVAEMAEALATFKLCFSFVEDAPPQTPFYLILLHIELLLPH